MFLSALMFDLALWTLFLEKIEHTSNHNNGSGRCTVYSNNSQSASKYQYYYNRAVLTSNWDF